MSHNPGSTHDLSIQAPNLHTARLFCHFQTNFCKRKQHFRQTSAKSCWKLNVSWESPSGWNNLWLPIQNILGAWGQPGMPVQVLTKKWRGGNSQIAQHQKRAQNLCQDCKQGLSDTFLWARFIYRHGTIGATKLVSHLGRDTDLLYWRLLTILRFTQNSLHLECYTSLRAPGCPQINFSSAEHCKNTNDHVASFIIGNLKIGWPA